MTHILPTLTALPIKDLHSLYLTTFGQPTASRNRPWLIKKLQAATQPDGTARASSEPAPAPRAPAPAPAPEPISEPGLDPAVDPLALGSVIRRDWRGRTLKVTVVEGGFRLDGTTYRSLSAAATALCGSNRNGLVFFGLKPRPAKKAAGGAP